MKISQFMTYMEARTQSLETLRAYRSSLVRFAAYLDKENLSADQIRRQTISEVHQFLAEEQKKNDQGAVERRHDQ
jgi:site-specific recombinase XerD